MASEPKTFPLRLARQPTAVRRIAQLAAEPALREAQLWLTRERSWINQIQLELCRIPAPTFFESERAGWFERQLLNLGWTARTDRAGNVLASFGKEVSESGALPPLVVSAHLDTVFAPARPSDISMTADGRLSGSGVSDNGSGLAALLALARLLAEQATLAELAGHVLLVANVGEEGEGNLSGMRYLCRRMTAGDLSAFVVLDGPSIDHVTSRALASRRFEVLLSGPGGHSWNDYGRPNAVHAIGELVSYFVQAAEARIGADPGTRAAFNFGILEGGTSINAIPSSARAKLDLRSESAPVLEELAALLSAAVDRSLERGNRSASQAARLSARVRELGARPGGHLPENSPLLASIQAVDGYLNIRSRMDCASTDANVPLSMGLPAISIGAGGQGGGAHTSGEWYQPEGRETGLLRILLLLADMNGLANGSSSPAGGAHEE